MKEILKGGGKLFVRTVLINIMSFFVVMSLIFFGVTAFSEEVGYVAYGTKSETEESQKLYTYYNTDGEDTELLKYEQQGYTVTKSAIREVSKAKDTAILLVAQAFALGILICFVYPSLWDKGNADCNMVKIGQQKEDILKGLKIGCVAAVPSGLFYLFLAITKNNVSAKLPASIYKFATATFYPVNEFIVGKSDKLSDLSVLQLLLLALPLLALPIIAFIGYYLGYKGFSISEKLTYKKTK